MEKGKTAKEIIAGAQETIPGLHEWNPHPPSVLGFKYLFLGPGEPTASNLWMRVPLAGDGEKSWRSWPAIWHNGKWKFCDWGFFD